MHAMRTIIPPSYFFALDVFTNSYHQTPISTFIFLDGSYDELIADENVDIVYVGNITSLRRKIGEKCLLGNKHVLLEKPFACSADDTKYLIGLAKERNLFLMEGMWTRFFPAIEQARRAVFGDGKDQKGVIGEVVMVQSDFNFNASDSEVYPTSPVYKHDQGGKKSGLVNSIQLDNSPQPAFRENISTMLYLC